MFRIVRLAAAGAAAFTAALFAAGPAVAAPPQPEGSASATRTVVQEVRVPVPVPAPAPPAEQDGYAGTLQMVAAGATGALVVMLVHRRRRPRRDGPAGRVIELTDAPGPTGM